MEKLELVLSAIEEKICEKIDILIKRNFTCCESCGNIKILNESGFYEFKGYMFYPINQHIQWIKQIENKQLEYIEIKWYWNKILNNKTQSTMFTNEEDDFILLCKTICEITNKISKHINMSGKSVNEPLVMKINKCLFM